MEKTANMEDGKLTLYGNAFIKANIFNYFTVHMYQNYINIMENKLRFCYICMR